MAEKKQKSDKKAKVKDDIDPEPLQLEVKAVETLKQSNLTQGAPAETESQQATVTTTETVKRKSGGPRSVCAMYKVVVKKALNRKIKVTYNALGVPNGSTRHTLQSYVGMLARTMVPIDIPSWPNVESNLKQKLWLDVQVIFVLCDICFL